MGKRKRELCVVLWAILLELESHLSVIVSIYFRVEFQYNVFLNFALTLLYLGYLGNRDVLMVETFLNKSAGKHVNKLSFVLFTFTIN